MTTAQLYDQYQQTLALRHHQLMVAAVADHICQLSNLDQTQRSEVVRAGLVHDLANVLKFNFQVLPELLEPEGAGYWQQVQLDWIKRYGRSVPAATQQILRALGVSQRIKELVAAVSFRAAKTNRDSDDLGKKIIAYADLRVSPKGVVSLRERLVEAQQRYQFKHSPVEAKFEREMIRCLFEIEQQLIEKCPGFDPNGLTDQLVKFTPGYLGWQW